MTQPLLEVLADAGALAQRAADLMLPAASAKNGPFSVALSGGSTPKRHYQLLATLPFPCASRIIVAGARGVEEIER
jgi:6-phosphogluconolactonase/glucosamine-6-phosphate isomerase/deaminase